MHIKRCFIIVLKYAEKGSARHCSARSFFAFMDTINTNCVNCAIYVIYAICTICAIYAIYVIYAICAGQTVYAVFICGGRMIFIKHTC